MRRSEPSERLIKRQAARLKPLGFVVLSFCGLVVSILSTIKLTIELTPLKLSGIALQWVEAYARFVAHITRPVFGWIDLWWMRITEIESHFAVVGTVLLATVARVVWADGSVNYGAPSTRGRSRGLACLFLAHFIFIIILPLALLPGWWGIAIAGINLLALAILTFRSHQC